MNTHTYIRVVNTQTPTSFILALTFRLNVNNQLTVERVLRAGDVVWC